MNKKNIIRAALAAVFLGVSVWALSAGGSGGTAAQGVLQVQGYDHGTQAPSTTNPGDHPGGDTTSVGQATHGQYANCKEFASSGAYYDHGGHVKITMTGHPDFNYDFTYGWLIKLPNTQDSYSWTLKITSNDAVGSYSDSGKVYKCKTSPSTTLPGSTAPVTTTATTAAPTTASVSSSAAPSTASASTVSPATTGSPSTAATPTTLQSAAVDTLPPTVSPATTLAPVKVLQPTR